MSHIKNVAIVGATGSVGKFIVDELLEAGKHQVTAITRIDSDSAIPEGVKVAKVNYDDHSTLVDALKGQEVLIITMSVQAPKDQQSKLVEAAAEAGVPWILPNEWGGDQTNESLSNDIFLGPASRANRKHIEDLGKSSWIGIASNFWYEYSLGGTADRYGFDFKTRSVVFFDDGKVPINTTTWPQSGKAVANLLALKTYPDGDDDKSTTLSSFKNKFVYISSFCVSQQDMFESVLRVTKTKPGDWKISHENSQERYQNGVEMMREGNLLGFVRAMYTRMFFPDGSGVYETTKGLQNEVLGLQKEDLDEYTKIGIERAGVVF
ncbi:CipA protein [Xylariales sp. AK1849]|nr:CipA protein [Xylariales sp. AK1849]